MATDRETPWKELLEQQPERAVSFFYSDIHADQDWAQDVESLEQEFRKSAPEAVTGKRIVDKLLKTMGKSGDARYLHFEIQAYDEEDFPYRVYVYNCCAEIRYAQPIVSLPILIDDDLTWVPTEYSAELYGTRRVLTFRTTKVIRWRGREDELLNHPNPVALFVLAFLDGRRLENDEAGRATATIRLMRRLKEMGMDVAEMGPWLGFFRWFLPLSKEYNARLAQVMNPDEKENLMPLMSYWEEAGLEKGKIAGLIQAVALGLDLKFGQEGMALMPQVEKIESLSILQAIYDHIKPAASLDEIRNLLPAATNGQH